MGSAHFSCINTGSADLALPLNTEQDTHIKTRIFTGLMPREIVSERDEKAGSEVFPPEHQRKLS